MALETTLQQPPKIEAPLLEVCDLQVAFGDREHPVPAVEKLSFSIENGKVFALVGESGCGKSTAALSLMGLTSGVCPGYPRGRALFEGRDLLGMSERELQALRGNAISMVFQEPMTSLNPVMRVGAQIDEALILHQRMTPRQARQQSVEMLATVRMPDPRRQAQCFPHELSGGMKQRVMIAMALACRPKLLIADEPTTALDVTIQAQILELMNDLRKSYQMSVLLITHNIGIVAEYADHVGIMYAGSLVESGPVGEVLKNPRHPYTCALLETLPGRHRRGQPLTVIPGQVPKPGSILRGCRFASRCSGELEICREKYPAEVLLSEVKVSCHLFSKDGTGSPAVEPASKQASSVASPKSPSLKGDAHGTEPLVRVENLRVHFPIRGGFFGRTREVVRAVDGVDFELPRGKTMALVGESGCGKTTVGLCMARLLMPTAGQVIHRGQSMLDLRGEALRKARRNIQMIFQDPYGSLNPRMHVRDILAEGPRAHAMFKTRFELEHKLDELMDMVQLDRDMLNRYPHEFSGGQRQRIGIARALALEPQFIICDEVTSALDVSVQAQILNLLKSLQTRLGLTYLFITHDLSVVQYIADHVLVMYLGRIVESADTESLFANPAHPYTRALFSSVPNPDPAQRHVRQPLEGDVPSPSSPPPGCHFHPRCLVAIPECRTVYPENREISPTRKSACHIAELGAVSASAVADSSSRHKTN